MRFFLVVGLATFAAVACARSSAETPFPQEPDRAELKRRSSAPSKDYQTFPRPGAAPENSPKPDEEVEIVEVPSKGALADAGVSDAVSETTD